MNFKKSKSGFTLIELLVVVAIIGILAVVVLAALREAKNRSIDAKVKATLSQMRPQAELYRLQYGSFSSSPVPYGFTYYNNTEANCDWAGGGVFNPNAQYSINAMLDDAAHTFDGTNPSGQWNSWSGICQVGANGESWMAAAALRQGNNNYASPYWCVDSSGASKELPAAPLPWPASNQQVKCP